jgi:hypothetical protein
MTFSTPDPSPNQTWIDAPLNNSAIPLQPYKLVFHGASFVGVTEFEIQVNGVGIATVPPISTSSGGSQMGTLFLGEYNWTPPAPGTYLIKVRAKGNGQFSSPDQVQVTVDGPEEVIAEEVIAEEVIAVDSECIFISLANLFCRRGPGTLYQEIDNFIPEQTAPIVGQSTDGFFWYVFGPNFGELCTVPSDQKFSKTDGNCDELPRFTPVPLPTATEEPMGCTVRRPSDEVIICVVPCPPDADPGESCTP